MISRCKLCKNLLPLLGARYVFEILLLIICSALCSCSDSASHSNPVAIKPAFAPVSSEVINGLHERIANLPKGDSLPISTTLRHLGLLKYRKKIQPERHSNVVSLNLNDSGTEYIVFVAEEERMAITREHVTKFDNWWDAYIKDLHVQRIIFRGIQTDLK